MLSIRRPSHYPIADCRRPERLSEEPRKSDSSRRNCLNRSLRKLRQVSAVSVLQQEWQREDLNALSMVVPTRTRALLATPRKASTSSPLRARIAKPPNKRRRLLDEGAAQLGPAYDVLNAKAGEQAVNGNSRKGRKPRQSPRKRKRAPSVEEESDTGSWVPAGSASGSSTSEDEAEGGDEQMQFIDEGRYRSPCSTWAYISDDRHLLREASSAHLQRLRKQELARLWRVAGLDSADNSEGDDNDELRKAELVEGIIRAVSCFGCPARL